MRRSVGNKSRTFLYLNADGSFYTYGWQFTAENWSVVYRDWDVRGTIPLPKPQNLSRSGSLLSLRDTTPYPFFLSRIQLKDTISWIALRGTGNGFSLVHAVEASYRATPVVPRSGGTPSSDRLILTLQFCKIYRTGAGLQQVPCLAFQLSALEITNITWPKGIDDDILCDMRNPWLL